MELSDATKLIRSDELQIGQPQVWVDLGCGDGLFTRALAGLLPAGSEIYAVDRSWKDFGNDLENNVDIRFIQADFEKEDLNLPQLDGILMANSLHYIKHKLSFTEKLKSLIRPNGKFLIIEYDTTQINPWIPYPVNFEQLKGLFRKAGYSRILKLGEKPSSFGNKKMYSCLVLK